MSMRMLIDGTHPEEVRVVVTSGNRLEEYDVETSTKKQLKGNIYLAKVTRVEPSLQAAFVDYGGNRHGFLAFSEIHPDYYQIPIADREALLADREGLEAHAKAAQTLVDEIDGGISDDDLESEAEDGDDAVEAKDAADDEPAAEGEGGETPDSAHDDAAAPDTDEDNSNAVAEASEDEDDGHATERGERRRRRSYRRYKIQEVIKRRQILLVQVVKEERGNKGAALTTYISLAGRYCVLMPNTARGGGISRKITSQTSRRKLKGILNALDIPDGMGVIMRTAGMERNRSEIKRDFEYLIRAWDEVRELTLKSTAPTLVYEEASLIKRAIRDLYTKEIEEVLVDGTEAYQTAKKFMRLLMPSHAKRVQPYRDPTIPLYFRYQVEGQLDAMYSPVVQLKSGGYLVLHATEALVAIDVNSGRSTRERNIEETALKTNLEAADEAARQLRLRDLAGLVVVDFIDMEENRNVRAVEKRMKEAMKTDRARIQIGRISNFGLLELSRQRLRPSLLEASTEPCPHCVGTGFIRSTESMAMHVLRAIEEEGIRRRSSEVSVAVATPVALYVLNQKRAALTQIEERYRFSVTITGDDTVVPPDIRLERVKARADEVEEKTAISMEQVAEEDQAAEAAAEKAEAEPEEGGRRRPRRRRRGRKPEEAHAVAALVEAAEHDADAEIDAEAEAEAADAEHGEDGETEAPARRRRRGKRGGRRRSRRASETGSETAEQVAAAPDEQPVVTHWPESDAPEPPARDDFAPDPGMAAEPATVVDAPEPSRWIDETPSREAPSPDEFHPDPGSIAAAAQADTGDTAAEENAAEVAHHWPETPSPDAPSPDDFHPDPGYSAEAETKIEPATNGETATEDEPEAPSEVPPAVASDEPKRRGWWNRLVE